MAEIINIHDWASERGRAVPDKDERTELETMNAISHGWYPGIQGSLDRGRIFYYNCENSGIQILHPSKHKPASQTRDAGMFPPTAA